MKKRGFGANKWNGFGGKVQDETLEEAAIRELQEECGIIATTEALEKVATLDFFFPHKKEWDQQVHVFLLKQWQNEPQESEEMKPEWFSFAELPLGNMWADDAHWLPPVLAGKTGTASFTFTEEESIASKDVRLE